MELQITGKNVKLVPAVRKYIERKLGKLGRHLSDIIDYKVEVSEEKTKSPQQHFVVQVTINSSGTLLRGEERGQDLFTAIDKVAEVMNRQIEHYKGKLYEKGRGSSLARGGFSEEAEEKQPVSRVVKVKQFAIKPMSVAEAIDQMELLGHDFFLFLNADTEKVNLVYRRRDGSYGLIEPELG
ncbi:Ribosome hibernation promotion factor [subsurface metagenome]